MINGKEYRVVGCRKPESGESWLNGGPHTNDYFTSVTCELSVTNKDICGFLPGDARVIVEEIEEAPCPDDLSYVYEDGPNATIQVNVDIQGTERLERVLEALQS